MKVALTIAGSDPSGGAGLQADLKTFHQFGVYGTSVVTALTVQNTAGLFGTHAVASDVVGAQLKAVVDDLRPAALKTGMLATAAIVDRVANDLARLALGPLVVDPVMTAGAGGELLSPDGVAALREHLLPLAALVTPNLDEAEALTGHTVRDPAAMERAGAALLRCGARAALVKGGHLAGETITDVLVTDRGVGRYTHARLDRGPTHGTGCTLSAAITASLALGRDLEGAVAGAIEFVQRAIGAAPGLGSGRGPLQHGVEPPAT